MTLCNYVEAISTRHFSFAFHNLLRLGTSRSSASDPSSPCSSGFIFHVQRQLFDMKDSCCFLLDGDFCYQNYHHACYYNFLSQASSYRRCSSSYLSCFTNDNFISTYISSKFSICLKLLIFHHTTSIILEVLQELSVFHKGFCLFIYLKQLCLKGSTLSWNKGIFTFRSIFLMIYHRSQ